MEGKRHILVNKQNKYNADDYADLDYETILIRVFNDNELVDGDIVHIDDNGRKWIETYIEKETLQAFNQLKELAKEKYGVDIEIIEAGRTLEKQDKYYQNAIERKGQEYADNYVAKPGYSEHHTGRALDYSVRIPKVAAIKNPILKKIVYKLKKPVAFTKINNEAAKLGLIVRYPMFGMKFTGYKHERWHLTNVGDPVLASFLRKHNMPLEKFYANASKYAGAYEKFAEEFERKNPDIIASSEDDGMDM